MMPRVIFDTEHEQFRDSVRRYIQGEVGPRAEGWRKAGQVDKQAWRGLGEQGYLLMWAPEEYGGLGIEDFRYDQILYEENVRYGEVGFYMQLHSRLVAPYIGHFGSAEQKARFLPDCISGETVLAVAMTEPGAGSDLAGMKMRAEDKGDHWLLNGSKTYISNGLTADLILVAARTVPDARYGIGLFLVEADMPGFSRGQKLHKMGLDAQDTAELFFQDVKVPKANVLGDPTQGFTYMMQGLAEERLTGSVMSMASAQTAFDLTLEYIRERRAFGVTVGSFQNSRFKMADMRSQLDAVQTFLDQCVLLHNKKQLSSEVAAQIKLLTTELEGKVIDECLQLFGGAGYMEEYRICRMYRDARITRIFAGTSEIMKEIVGRKLGLDDRKR
ncbi:acyl-CoA dehydrogenase family protein [Pseudomonas sp. NFACC13-1]|uniref:acyl-CoA dehydrogenase family protein n=1 Tax=Pseudomonas sp. NFACC13-1 TaxID=1566245 RepID=UPI000881E467|nr:acyl-CoA dehydrogenase family protein [Pseudomonas sp. NFACC13-1]SDB35195.1 acyl-CoA dehydrogenase [Pseudomonas sp. NFACC13-1]